LDGQLPPFSHGPDKTSFGRVSRLPLGGFFFPPSSRVSKTIETAQIVDETLSRCFSCQPIFLPSFSFRDDDNKFTMVLREHSFALDDGPKLMTYNGI
jgi:hypothetical protein